MGWGLGLLSDPHRVCARAGAELKPAVEPARVKAQEGRGKDAVPGAGPEKPALTQGLADS